MLLYCVKIKMTKQYFMDSYEWSKLNFSKQSDKIVNKNFSSYLWGEGKERRSYKKRGTHSSSSILANTYF